MKVKDAMTENPICCDQHESVQGAARLMLSRNCGVLPVTDSQGYLVGMITDRDIACRAVAAGKDSHGIVQEFMTSPAVSVRGDTPMPEACRLMEDYQIRRLPAVDTENH